jgi:hypothetical protein
VEGKMKIELDWQIIEGEDAELQVIAAPPPPRPRRKLPRWLWLLVLIPVVAVAAFAAYVAQVYRTQLARAAQEVTAVAKQEARAIADNDRETFMALQDPDDEAFRAMQERRFARQDRTGLFEYGLRSITTSLTFGPVLLEPGVAQLDVLRQFSVTLPMPDGPVSVTLAAPQYYRRTASGWVRAQPGRDFWGSEQSLSRKHVMMLYSRRDADLVEPLALKMDAMLERLCATLTCPPQVTVTFETSLSAVGSAYGLALSTVGENTLTLKLLSPHLASLPTDARSRDEFYRDVETRVVRELVLSSLGPDRRAAFNSVPVQQLTRWYLAQAGVSGPFITPDMTRALAAAVQSGTLPTLNNIVLERYSSRTETLFGETIIPLAFEFIARRLGAQALGRLAPALSNSPTLGEALRAALHVNPISLEPDWRDYVREQAGLLPTAYTDTPECSNVAWRPYSEGNSRLNRR